MGLELAAEAADASTAFSSSSRPSQRSLTVVRSRSTPLAFLLMADNAVRHVGFFQVGNLLLRELHGQSPDGIFQM